MTRFDSIFVATDEPDALAGWYASLLGATREGEHVVHVGDVHLLFFPHDAVHGPNSQPERIMVNFAVDDAEAFARHADELGVTWKRPFEPEPFGLLATIVDPAGNFVQVAQHGVAAEGVA